MKSLRSVSVAVLCSFLVSRVLFGSAGPDTSFVEPEVGNGLKVSANQRYLVDGKTGAPVFILADTAWNLGSLRLEEVDTYLQSRADHGFNTVMFALNFAPQAEENNAYGQPAYIGVEKTELNPAYFEYCDAIVAGLPPTGCM